MEWKDYFKNETDTQTEEREEETIQSKKLKITKFSRPDKQFLSTETNTYVEMVTNKLRNVKTNIDNNYRKKNNLTIDLRHSLNNLKRMVQQKVIAICRSDKDGKTIILKHEDYLKIIEKDLEEYTKMELDTQNVDSSLKKTKNEGINMVIELFNKGCISENLLYLTTGHKTNKNGQMAKMTGTSAKFFDNLNAAYVYPLFKTHKLNNITLESCKIEDIPTRLVQSAGDAYLYRITAFLEEILGPISIKYCQTGINEYCKDSSNYTNKLFHWKNIVKENEREQNYKLVAADVKALYPSVPRNLIKISLMEALHLCSNWPKCAQEILVELTMHCLNNIILQFNGQYYQQTNGIVTGDNNSVSLANISLHFIIKKIKEIKHHTEIFVRFIDDIMYITKDNRNAIKIKTRLSEEFEKHDLKLLFREISTKEEKEEVEFLDVLHYTQKEATKGFCIKDFVKPTAVDSTFLNGKSYHPDHIFTGIIFGEAKRLRRLNETDITYKESIERLRNKCIRSHFKKTIVDNSISIVKNWNTKYLPQSINEEERIENTKIEEKGMKNRTIWATKFYNNIRLNKKEKKTATWIIYYI